MNFKQRVNAITRPVSGSCLDHIWSTQPQHIKSISCYDVGLADHLPVFAVHKFVEGNKNFWSSDGTKFIRYRNMKTFNDAEFITTLKHAPWDIVFVFDEVDDMLQCWESIFNSCLDLHCPWREKREARTVQNPWITNSVMKSHYMRDKLLVS